MASIEGVCREVCDATEYVTIVTNGPDGPHLAGHWGSYMRIVEPGETVVFPVGRFQRTEQNLRANGRIQLMVASRKVQGTRSPLTAHWPLQIGAQTLPNQPAPPLQPTRKR